MIDSHVVEIFKRYYTLLQRDNPNNRGEAMQTAATLTQAQITNEASDKLSPHYQIDYTTKFNELNMCLNDIKDSLNISLIEIKDELKSIKCRL